MGGHRFRVEILHPRRMPWWLLRPLTTLLSCDEPDARMKSHLLKSASAHLGDLSANLEELAAADYAERLAELLAWIGEHPKPKTIEVARHSTFLAWKLDRYEEACIYLNESFFSLVAFAFLAAGLERKEIPVRLQDQSWATKHEVLGRWGWMKVQRGLLRKGTRFTRLFPGQAATSKRRPRHCTRHFGGVSRRRSTRSDHGSNPPCAPATSFCIRTSILDATQTLSSPSFGGSCSPKSTLTSSGSGYWTNSG